MIWMAVVTSMKACFLGDCRVFEPNSTICAVIKITSRIVIYAFQCVGMNFQCSRIINR